VPTVLPKPFVPIVDFAITVVKYLLALTVELLLVFVYCVLITATPAILADIVAVVDCAPSVTVAVNLFKTVLTVMVLLGAALVRTAIPVVLFLRAVIVVSCCKLVLIVLELPGVITATKETFLGNISRSRGVVVVLL